MSSEMKIDAALAKLESGKFSFQMADAIKNHVSKLECELEVARSLHASAIRELKVKEYANWRLEGELSRLNAKIYALLRANMLTKKAYRELIPVAAKLEAYFVASLKLARAAVERAAADLKSGKFHAQVVDASSKIYELLKANAPTEKTFREMQPYAIKMGEYSEVLKKRAAAVMVRATAYLSNLHKTSA